jgi:uncharacterized protein
VWDWKQLADDAAEDDEPRPTAFRGATFAWNCTTPAEVDAALDKALAAGARLLRKADKTDYGGYRGYFSDPDGHCWEVVQAPGLNLTDESCPIVEFSPPFPWRNRRRRTQGLT